MPIDFRKPSGGPQVTTGDSLQPRKPRKTRRPATPPRVVTGQPVPKDFRSPPSSPLDIDNKVYRPPPQVAPQAPYNRPVPTAPIAIPPRMPPPGPPMDLPPRAHPMTTVPFAQRPFNPFAPVTPPAPSFPMNPISPNIPTSTMPMGPTSRIRSQPTATASLAPFDPVTGVWNFPDFRNPGQAPRFADHRGSLRNLLNRRLSEGVGQQ
jgi:hypothetical protein